MHRKLAARMAAVAAVATDNTDAMLVALAVRTAKSAAARRVRWQAIKGVMHTAQPWFRC